MQTLDLKLKLDFEDIETKKIAVSFLGIGIFFLNVESVTYCFFIRPRNRPNNQNNRVPNVGQRRLEA